MFVQKKLILYINCRQHAVCAERSPLSIILNCFMSCFMTCFMVVLWLFYRSLLAGWFPPPPCSGALARVHSALVPFLAPPLLFWRAQSDAQRTRPCSNAPALGPAPPRLCTAPLPLFWRRRLAPLPLL